MASAVLALTNEERNARRDEIAPRVMARVARGQLVKAACSREGIPTRTFREWISQDPRLRAEFDRARVDQAHALAEESLRIADSNVGDMAQVQRNRLRVDTRKWYVSKIAPAVFGDRVEHSHTHRVGVVMLPPIAEQVPGLVPGPGQALAGITAGTSDEDRERKAGKDMETGSPSHARAFAGSAGPVAVVARPLGTFGPAAFDLQSDANEDVSQ